MRRLLTLIGIVLLAGCRGGAGLDGPAAENNPGQLQLLLSAVQAGADWDLILSAHQASDLYQIAGALEFDATRYELLSSEAGGGLGGPDDSYFLAEQRQLGRLDFAYTMRFWGSGANGSLELLRLRVRAQNEMHLTDFELRTGPGELIARNGRKQQFTGVQCRREQAQ